MNTYVKELSEYESNVAKTRSAYSKAAKALEAAVSKRDAQNASDASKKSIIGKLEEKVSELVDGYLDTRQRYIDCVLQLQTAELVHRDRMLSAMIRFDELDRCRIRDSKNSLLKSLEARSKIIGTNGIPNLIGSARKELEKINEVSDIEAFVTSLHDDKSEIPKKTTEVEQVDEVFVAAGILEKPPPRKCPLLYTKYR